MVHLPKNIETLIEEGGEITVGRAPAHNCVATATDDADVCLAMLVRRDGETLNQLIKRMRSIDHALAPAAVRVPDDGDGALRQRSS
jgi:hypothetical protein